MYTNLHACIYVYINISIYPCLSHILPSVPAGLPPVDLVHIGTRYSLPGHPKQLRILAEKIWLNSTDIPLIYIYIYIYICMYVCIMYI